MRLDKAHPEVLQEAWSLVNDSLRTMLCVRYRSNIIACGIIYYAAWRLKVRAIPTTLAAGWAERLPAPSWQRGEQPACRCCLQACCAARQLRAAPLAGAVTPPPNRHTNAISLQVPLPEQPPWWELFEVEEAGIYEVCRTMHELYLAPKAHHIPVYRNILPSKPGTPATPATHAKGFDGDTEPRVPVGRQLGPSPGAVLQAAVAAAAEAVRGEPPSASITPALQAGSEPAAAGEPQQQGDAAAALPPPPSPSGDATAGGEAGARSGSLSRGPRLGRRSPSRSPPQSERELKRRRSLSPVGGGSSLHHRDRSTSHLRDREHDREPLERARHHHGRHQHQHHRDRDRDRDRERGRERERSPVSRSRERDRDDRERVRERSDRGGRQRERGRLERSSAGGDGGRRRDGGSVGGREAARPAERQRRSPPEGSPEEGGRREAARPAEQQRRSQPEALPEEGGSRKRPISAAAAAQGDSDDEGGGLGGNGTFSDLPPGLAARLGGTQRGAEKGARGADGRDGSGSSQQRVGGGDKPRRLPPPPAADEERGAPASENGGAAAGGSPASSGMEGSGG